MREADRSTPPQELRRVWLWLALTAVSALALAGWWNAFGPGAALPALSAANASQLELGGQLYRQHCAACHGDRLQGQTDWRRRKPDGRLPAPPHDDSGHTWHHPDAVLMSIVRDGLRPPNAPPGYQSDMPAYRGQLDDQQIWAVLAYIASQWSQASCEHQARITRMHSQMH